MADHYVSGDWLVRAGSEQDFTERWVAFTSWSLANAPGASSFVLIRDEADPRHFLSFGVWADAGSRAAWRQRPEFAELLGRCREVCEEVRGGDYLLAASPRGA